MTGKRDITANLLEKELLFTTSRSSGPGGQNVNKVNSRVTVHFNVAHSAILTDEEKQTLMRKLGGKLTREGEIMVSAQDSRSQLDNRAKAIEKFDRLLTRAFAEKKPRKATRPTKGSVQERIRNKRRRNEKKQWRKKGDDNDV